MFTAGLLTLAVVLFAFIHGAVSDCSCGQYGCLAGYVETAHNGPLTKLRIDYTPDVRINAIIAEYGSMSGLVIGTPKGDYIHEVDLSNNNRIHRVNGAIIYDEEKGCCDLLCIDITSTKQGRVLLGSQAVSHNFFTSTKGGKLTGIDGYTGDCDCPIQCVFFRYNKKCKCSEEVVLP